MDVHAAGLKQADFLAVPQHPILGPEGFARHEARFDDDTVLFEVFPDIFAVELEAGVIVNQDGIVFRIDLVAHLMGRGRALLVVDEIHAGSTDEGKLGDLRFIEHLSVRVLQPVSDLCRAGVSQKIQLTRLALDGEHIVFKGIHLPFIFNKVKNLVDTGYVFTGAYRMSKELSDTTQIIWVRVADEVDLNSLNYLNELRN